PRALHSFPTRRSSDLTVRVVNPIQVFKNLLVCFASANSSNLVVGVNIVAPEHNEISMRDYWLHMQMFKFFSHKFPDVKVAMHAGDRKSTRLNSSHVKI